MYLNAIERSLQQCLSAWGQQSFGMHMPSGLLHWPCDSLVHSVSLHAGFFQPFFFGVFFSVSSSFPFWSTQSFFTSVFLKVCLYTCLAIRLTASWPHTPISLSTILDCVPHQSEAGWAPANKSTWRKDCCLLRCQNLSKVFRILTHLSSRNGLRRTVSPQKSNNSWL